MQPHAGNVGHSRKGIQRLDDVVGPEELLRLPPATLMLLAVLPGLLSSLRRVWEGRSLCCIKVNRGTWIVLETVDPSVDPIKRGGGGVHGESHPLAPATPGSSILTLVAMARLERIRRVATFPAVEPIIRGWNSLLGGIIPGAVEVPMAPQEQPPPQLPAPGWQHLA